MPMATPPTATGGRRSSTSSAGAPTPPSPAADGSRTALPAARRRTSRDGGVLTRLVDGRYHLNADRFKADADQVLGAARLGGVERVLVPGWNVRARARARVRGAVRMARCRGGCPPARRGESG